MKLSKLVKIVVVALEDIKAFDIEVLDVTDVSTICDCMIVASAVSARQTKALAKNVQEKVKASGGVVYGTEGEQTGEWVLVDLGDLLVHVMQPTARTYYNLEELWSGIETVKVKKPVTKKTHAAKKSSVAKKAPVAKRIKSEKI